MSEWTRAYAAWVTGLLSRKGHLEPRILEIPERCAALEAPQADGKGERSCHFDIMHKGPHSWALPVCAGCGRVPRLDDVYHYGDELLCGLCAWERDPEFVTECEEG